MRKKIVSLIVSSLMIVSSVTAFANPVTNQVSQNLKGIENQVQPRGGYSDFNVGDGCYMVRGGELRDQPGDYNNHTVIGNVRRFDLCIFRNDSYTPEDDNYWALVRVTTGECAGETGWVRLENIKLDIY